MNLCAYGNAAGRGCRHFGLLIVLLAGLGPVLFGSTALGKQSVVSSPHNLSASGGGGQHNVTFATETRICVFCHVPHAAKVSQPLWSRDLPPETSYTPYSSSTLHADPKPDLPTGASRLCLSCHDGTIALGLYVGSRVSGSTVIPTDPEPRFNPNLGTDLSDDHPISFFYSETLAGQGELVSPAALPAEIRLDQDGMLQCTACHDPHNNQFGNFLVMDNSQSGSPLCIACHDNTGWSGAAHNPQQSPVLANACMNCHYVHSAPEPVRLLKRPKEEENCTLTCHNGIDVNSVDIQTVMGTLYRHPVDFTTGVHDPRENLPASNYHVECVDCHNPHQATNADIPLASPPAVNGPLLGVRKDDAGGIAATEFDICFRCHAGPAAGSFAGISEAPSNRQLPDADLRNRFDENNPSFHPVVADRRGSGASLLLPLQAGMTRIYCSDCHNSDQSSRAIGSGSGANGPHGSNYEHILIARYDMPIPSSPPAPYSSALYALCFRCHDETFLMDSSSAFVKKGNNLHNLHVRIRNVPCFACHDPHGVSSLVGATAANNAHLINFERDYTVSGAVPVPQYQTLAPASGSCTVSCHSNPTQTRTYSP